MRKSLSILCYFIGGIGLLSSFSALSKLGESGPTNGPGLAGYLVGVLFVPSVFFLLGYSFSKDPS